jgi:lysine 2,3-aminomutase
LYPREEASFSDRRFSGPPGISRGEGGEGGEGAADIGSEAAASGVPILPFSVTSYYLSLIGEGEGDPIRRQCIPTDRELVTLPQENRDPLDEASYEPVPNLIHRYPDRVLFRVTDECAVYCRHCFRRFFAGGRRGGCTEAEVGQAAEYLSAHPEVKECILSGGDPLTLDGARLEALMAALRRSRPELLLRVASRFPAVAPRAVTGPLVQLLRRFAPLYLITQFNHSRELTGESSRALAALADAGIPVLNQSVLLRGVNDDPEELARLCRGLTARRVTPYYLFQGDLAPGTSHFRVPLDEGMALAEELRRRVSGIAMPVYAVDLPDGGGKIPLTESYFVDRRGGGYRFRSLEGGIFTYPAE